MASYTRQSSFADGDTITAALFNNEFNQLVNAFHNSTGHKHDGTTAEGPVIGLIGDAGETAPNNKVLIDTTNNFIEFYVQVSSNPVQQLYIADGAIIPVTDSDVDLGTSSLRFKDAYIDTITTTGNVGVGGNLTVTGTTTFNGGTITMGDAATDNVVFGADVDSNIIPDDDDTYDLGSSSQEWRNLFIDGTANIDSLVADTADINAGTIDGTVIGGSSAAAITGTAITATSFVIGSADISEAELETIDGVTAGTVAASKAVVVDANKDIGSFRNITLTGELDAGSLDVSGNVDVDGTLETDALSINGTAVTSTAAELNILDGVTATATEINLIDGVTATTAELNILDGVTASAADINLIDGITNGTVIASKAIITDANIDITGGRNITISGELDAATLDISGDADIDGTLEADAITIGGVTLAETISDTVGAMVSSNTETNITVTYEDSDNTLDFALPASLEITTAVGVGGGSTNGVVISQGAISIKNGGTQSYVDFYCESSNAHYARLQAPAHSAFSGNITATLPATTGTLALTSDIHTTEELQDIIGAMVSSNTESGITVAYQDADGTIDFTVGTLNQDTTGSAATLTTPRAIAVAGDVTGTANFDGSAAISITTTLATDAIVTANITNANVTLAKMAANSVDSDQYVDGSIDTAHIANDQVTGDKLANDITIANNLTVAGNLAVTGTTTQTGSVVSDSNFTGLLDENTGNSSDFGLYGKYVESSTTKYAGLFYDASTDNTFRLFTDTQTVPGTTVNLGATGYAAANLIVNNLTGTLATAAQPNITSLGTLTALTGGTGDFNWDSNTLVVDSSTNRVGIGNASPDVSLDIGSFTDAVHMPTGNTSQRPGSPAAGYLRYNSETSKFEGYTTEWGSIAGGGSGTNMDTNIYAGDGSDTTFTLSTAPDSENNLMVFIDGVFQAHNSYSVSGTTLTFSTAPANGRVITAYHSTTTVGGSNNSIATMTGDGSDTTLSLSVAPVHENNVSIFFDGVYQSKANYAISGTTITFSTAPASGVAVEAITATNTSITTATQLVDADSDTMIQVEESSDEDTIRFDIAGAEDFTMTANTFTALSGSTIKTNTIAETTSASGVTIDSVLLKDGSVTSAAGGTFTTASGNDLNIVYPDSRSLFIKEGSTTHVTVNNTGNVGIGISSPTVPLDIQSNASASAIRIRGRSDDIAEVDFYNNANNSVMARFQVDTGYFATHCGGSERMRIDAAGNVGIGGAPGYRLDVETSAYDAAYINTSINSVGGGVVLILNRSAADGDMMRFQQGGTTEGTIVVSGSTVSYNGFSGNHESSGINSSTPIGTVVSTIDELDVYSDTQTDKGKDEPNPKAGQTRADHAKIKISDTEGDTRVYGILSSFNADGKAIVTSVGIGSIKVTGACNGGDLLESNGDGTAKVQSDDIVRSKTIGKVTIGNSDTGVKLVSCVLYCG